MSRIISAQDNIQDYFDDLKQQYKEQEKQYSYMRGQRDSLLQDINILKTKSIGLSHDIENRERVVVVLGKVSESMWENAKKLVEDIMPYGLKLVFGGNLGFKVESDVARNQSEAELIFLDNGQPRDIMESDGGSVADVVSALARMIVLLRSDRRKVLILDEPFKQMDLEKIPLVMRLLSELIEILNIQLLMVTHEKGFINSDFADRIFLMEKKNGRTECTQQT